MESVEVKKSAKIMSAVTAALLALSIAPSAALAADNGEAIVRTHTYLQSTGDSAPAAKTIEVDGASYTLVGTTEEAEPVTGHITHEVVTACGRDELDGAIAAVDKKLAYDENGVKGTLELTDVRSNPVGGMVPKMFSGSFGGSGFEYQDDSLAPASRAFTFDDGVSRTLNRTSMSWTQEASGLWSFSADYSAVHDAYDAAASYEIIATYEGDLPVASGDKKVTVTATYEKEVAAAGFPLAAVAGAVAAAAAASGIGIAWWRRSKARVVEVIRGGYTIVARCRIDREGDSVFVEVPSDVDLSFSTSSHYMELELPAKYSDGAYHLCVSQNGETVFSGPSARATKLHKPTI